MPIIKMTETKKGSSNGILVQKFIKGRIYSVSDDLCNVFVNILLVAEPMPIKKVGLLKAEKKAPENKAMTVIPANKNEYITAKTQASAEEFVSKSQTRRMNIMKKSKKGNKGKK